MWLLQAALVEEKREEKKNYECVHQTTLSQTVTVPNNDAKYSVLKIHTDCTWYTSDWNTGNIACVPDLQNEYRVMTKHK